MLRWELPFNLPLAARKIEKSAQPRLDWVAYDLYSLYNDMILTAIGVVDILPRHNHPFPVANIKTQCFHFDTFIRVAVLVWIRLENLRAPFQNIFDSYHQIV